MREKWVSNWRSEEAVSNRGHAGEEKRGEREGEGEREGKEEGEKEEVD